VSRSVLYSESLKLSVDAKVASDPVMFTNKPASVGRIFPSALEKRVFSIDLRTISPLSERESSSLTPGITGKSSAGIPFIFVFPLSVLISRASPPLSSILTLSS
jgi:hypothetical protein